MLIKRSRFNFKPNTLSVTLQTIFRITTLLNVNLRLLRPLFLIFKEEMKADLKLESLKYQFSVGNNSSVRHLNESYNFCECQWTGKSKFSRLCLGVLCNRIDVIKACWLNYKTDRSKCDQKLILLKNESITITNHIYKSVNKGESL